MTLTCQVCGVTYSRRPSAATNSKHCSRICHNKVAGKIGGKAGKGVSRGKGRKRPDLRLRNLLNNPSKKGRENKLWKEIGQAYSTVHLQVNSLFTKKKSCELCGSVKNLHWSNKNHTYRLIESEWWTLCATCHTRYDAAQRGSVIITEKLCCGCGNVIVRTKRNTGDFWKKKFCNKECYYNNKSPRRG